jgi:hypothetical protein
MKTKKLYSYVNSFVDRHGRVRNYFRRKGQRIALPGRLGSPEFMLAYTAALSEPPGGGVVTRRAENPNVPLIGVYLLLRKGRITYIGSSINMPVRVANHRANGRQFDQAFYIATTADQREALEQVLIKTVNPTENRMHRSNGTETAVANLTAVANQDEKTTCRTGTS